MSASETVVDTGTTDLLCSIASGVATITLNRPDAKNALSPPMSQGLQAALATCNADHAVRVILLTGAGNAFCAGGDVKNMGDRRPKTLSPEERVKEMKQRHRGVGGGIASLSKPTIAALPGPRWARDWQSRSPATSVSRRSPPFSAAAIRRSD